MSKYSTGEIAQLCNVSVRTVQYYDSRGILIPEELSEGGRRLYSEEDLKKMKVICFLRKIGFSLNNIAALFEDSESKEVISILLERHEKELRQELELCQSKLDAVTALKKTIKSDADFSVESIADVANVMKNRKNMRKVRLVILTLGILAEIIEAVCLILGFTRGIWWPAIIGLPVFLALVVWLILFYYKKVDYICPKCHTVFKPRFKEFFFSSHTFSTRKLTCSVCGHKGFCVETYAQTKK